MRRRDSGITAKRGLWEVHRDPYDVSRVWVRNHRGDGEWIQATWKYLNRTPVPDALSKEEKYDYDEDRLDHHARLQVVATSTVRRTVTCGRRLTVLNRGAISARRGLIVTGPANTGKTIALTQLGLAHELQDRRRHPGQDERIPVIYITVPPAATPGTRRHCGTGSGRLERAGHGGCQNLKAERPRQKTLRARGRPTGPAFDRVSS